MQLLLGILVPALSGGTAKSSSFIGARLPPQLGIRIGAGIVSAIVSATIGAVVVLFILWVVRRSGRW